MPEWISYREKQPRVAGKYLVCGYDLKDNNRPVITVATWVNALYSFYGYISVQYWQPLPELPYQMKEIEEKKEKG